MAAQHLFGYPESFFSSHTRTKPVSHGYSRLVLRKVLAIFLSSSLLPRLVLRLDDFLTMHLLQLKVPAASHDLQVLPTLAYIQSTRACTLYMGKASHPPTNARRLLPPERRAYVRAHALSHAYAKQAKGTIG